jgi:hypothetical protein
MSNFECTFHEFKVQCAELIKMAEGASVESLDNGVKCLNLSLIYMNEPMWKSSARIAHTLVMRKIGVI